MCSSWPGLVSNNAVPSMSCAAEIAPKLSAQHCPARQTSPVFDKIDDFDAEHRRVANEVARVIECDARRLHDRRSRWLPTVRGRRLLYDRQVAVVWRNRWPSCVVVLLPPEPLGPMHSPPATTVATQLWSAIAQLCACTYACVRGMRSCMLVCGGVGVHLQVHVCVCVCVCVRVGVQLQVHVCGVWRGLWGIHGATARRSLRRRRTDVRERRPSSRSLARRPCAGRSRGSRA